MMGQFRSLGNLCTAAKARGDIKLARSYWEKQQLCRPETQQSLGFSDVKPSPGLARARTEPQALPGPAKIDAPAEPTPELTTDEVAVDSACTSSSSEPASDDCVAPDAADDDVGYAIPSLDSTEDAPPNNEAALTADALNPNDAVAAEKLKVGPEAGLPTSIGDVNAVSNEPTGPSAALATPGNPFSDADTAPPTAAAGDPFSDGAEEAAPAPVFPPGAPGNPFAAAPAEESQAAAVSVQASTDPSVSVADSLGTPGNPFGEVQSSIEPDSSNTSDSFCEYDATPLAVEPAPGNPFGTSPEAFCAADVTLTAVEPSDSGAPGNPFGSSPDSLLALPRSMSPKAPAATTVNGYTIATANSFEDFF